MYVFINYSIYNIIPMDKRHCYQENTHIDEQKLREMIFSQNRQTKYFAISSLTGMITRFHYLPSGIIEELVNIALDANLGVGTSGQAVTPLKIQMKTWSVLQNYIENTNDLSPLFKQVKKRMEADVEIHGGGFLLEICAQCIGVGKVSNDLLAVLAIGLKSPSVQEHNKHRTLELIEELIGKGVDVRKLKRTLKKAADGKIDCPQSKARGVYIEAASANFNKPPSWFMQKRDAFRMWKYSKKKIIPPPQMKLKRSS